MDLEESIPLQGSPWCALIHHTVDGKNTEYFIPRPDNWFT